MAVEAGAGRDEGNPAGTRVHKMKKCVVESGAHGPENVENNKLCKRSGS